MVAAFTRCQLQIGACYWHLPATSVRIKLHSAVAEAFYILWREFGVKTRSEDSVSWKETAEQVFES